MRGPVRLTRFCPDGTTLKMCSTRLHSDRTMLPVALLSLFDEQRRMHPARQIVAQVPAIVPLGVYVDGPIAPCESWQRRSSTSTTSAARCTSSR